MTRDRLLTLATASFLFMPIGCTLFNAREPADQSSDSNGDDDSSDAATMPDAGLPAPALDAGTGADATSPIYGGGAPPGLPGADAGIVVVDAASDTGPADAGVDVAMDTGSVAVPDAGGVTDAGTIDGCVPNPQCNPPSPSTGHNHQDCVDRINQFRACMCLPPLARWYDGESCADQDSRYDAQHYDPNSSSSFYQGFNGSVCEPEGIRESECYQWPTATSVIDVCVQGFFEEGPGTDTQTHGNFVDMMNPAYTMVACGFYTPSDNSGVWAVLNYQ